MFIKKSSIAIKLLTIFSFICVIPRNNGYVLTDASHNAVPNNNGINQFRNRVGQAIRFIEKSKRPSIADFNFILQNRQHNTIEIESLQALSNNIYNQRKKNIGRLGFGAVFGVGCLALGNELDSDYLKLAGMSFSIFFGMRSFFEMRKFNTSWLHKNLTEQLNNRVQNNNANPLVMPPMRFEKIFYKK